MKDLMIHVEEIVRPIRAFERRKLRMRRELLAHLSSALEEETRQDPAGALDRAKRRIGDPAALTRQFQQSVPEWERLLTAHLPMPALITRWEKRSEVHWAALTPGQGAAVLATGIVFALCNLTFSVHISRENSNQFFALFFDDYPRYLATCLGCAAIIFALQFTIMKLLTCLLHRASIARRLLPLSACIGLLQTLWILLIKSQVVGQAPGLLDIARGLGLGATIVLVLTLSAHFALLLGNPFREWRQIELAD
jgi:hypothetical protein